MQRQAHDLGRIDDPGFHHVEIATALYLEAVIGFGPFQQFADDDRAILSGIGKDPPRRRLQCLAYDIDADLLVSVPRVQPIELIARIRDA